MSRGGALKEKSLVLIVEDDQNVAEMLHTFLRTKQYRLLSTPLGKEVVDICKQHDPDLVLLDINLPDIDGYEVCRRLRETLTTSSIPIIFLTQKSLREDRLQGLGTGGDDYITKPFDIQELLLRMQSVLRRAKYRAGFDQISGLPGGPLVEERLKLLLNRRDWAILLVGVGNFECFTRQYGHMKDQFIGYVGQLVEQAANEAGNFEDFVGRVGTVDFVIITTPPRIARLRERIERKFNQAMNPAHGNGGKRPLTADLSLSFGIVLGSDGPYGDVRTLGEAIMRSRQSEF
ncbi:MAG: response regulator [Anaerolineae bacterium]|nr:response regulator [Anaerolineae bacterium]